jgi:hypothetical protein
MSDALDRLKQRQRPKVAPRDASLTSRPQDIQLSRHQDIQISRHIDADEVEAKADMAGLPALVESRHTDVQMSESLGRGRSAERSRHIDIQTSRPLDDEPPTKRSTFRLDADLIERLHNFCRHQGLSREVLIEAMYEYMEANPDALAQVVENASQKHDQRQQLANRKRAEAMMSKFGRDV